MADFKIVSDRENKQVGLTRSDLVVSCGNRQTGSFIKGCDRFKHAKILGFYKKNGIDYAFCQNVSAKTFKSNGRCGWFAIKVSNLD